MPEAALAAALAPLHQDPSALPPKIGVAVSGGGDSMALLYLVHDWARKQGLTLCAATVNHGLRPAAADEAAMVALICSGLGVAHQTLLWQGWDGRGNVQAKARTARRDLLTTWAQDQGLGVVLLGHTADDQAETFLMRLARGSGVDGLSGMPASDKGGLFLRPLLPVSRAELRDWLKARGIPWVEDPSNDDTRFDRVKARQMLATLAPLGLTVDRLTDTAAHMQRARASLNRAAADWAARHVRTEGGDLVFTAEALHLGRTDTEGRVFAAAVQWIGGSGYRPRYESLLDAASALRQGQTRTLGGVLMLPDQGQGARLLRESAAAQTPVSVRPDGAATPWDSRWHLSQTLPETRSAQCHIAALGETGLAQVPGWRAAGLPRISLLATPAVWSDSTLIAAPLAGMSNGWQANLSPSFESFILSH